MGLSDRLICDEPRGFSRGVQAKPVLVADPRGEVGSKSDGGQLNRLRLGRVPTGAGWAGRRLTVMGQGPRGHRPRLSDVRWPAVGRLRVQPAGESLHIGRERPGEGQDYVDVAEPRGLHRYSCLQCQRHAVIENMINQGVGLAAGRPHGHLGSVLQGHLQVAPGVPHLDTMVGELEQFIHAVAQRGGGTALIVPGWAAGLRL
jgi:hypothetical protein